MYLLDAIIPNRSFLRIKVRALLSLSLSLSLSLPHTHTHTPQPLILPWQVLDDEQKGDMIGETCIDLSQRWFAHALPFTSAH